jgi:3-hydroxyacyl-[acyl-carrier-protein] dehydratase
MDDQLRAILPHRPPMVMIDALLESTPEGALATKVFTGSDYAVDDNTVARSALIEGLAQTVAAAFGKEAREAGQRPLIGMLVGVTGFGFTRDVEAGEEVVFRATISRRLPPFYLAEGEVLCGGQVIAGGSMKFYIEEDDSDQAAGGA